MTETITREIDCLLCKKPFSPVIKPLDGQNFYRVYCSSCTHWVPIKNGEPVRVTLREVLGLKEEALALAVHTCLAKCSCGGEFSHDAGKRCPDCIEKIGRETRNSEKESDTFWCPWSFEELQKLETKVSAYILEKLASKEESLTGLIEKFESGQIGAEAYMEQLEELQFRESAQISVVQVWAMILGPDLIYRATEEHGLVDRYGTRILVNIARALETSTGKSVLATLASEAPNWDETVQKELKTFIAKIGGGF
ncbi:MAG: hypothetical protein V3U37_05570 [Nitrospinaceae bacterium]